MIRILHAADLHLDSPFEGLDRQRAALRRREQRRLIERITALAVERKADILLFSGDLFDTSAAFLETASCLEAALRTVRIPVFIAPGNHDYYAKGSPWTLMQLPENVHIFDGSTITCKELPKLHCRVWGAAFTDRRSGPMLEGFEAAKDGQTLDILCIHGELDGAPDSPYNPISREQLLRSGMDYVALGHVHTAGVPIRVGDCFCAWPGCAEGRGFDETGDKGVLYIELEPGACHAEHISICDRRYLDFTVDITGSADPVQTVFDALPDGCGRDICRVTLTGEAAVPVETGALNAALNERFFSAVLRDRSRPARALWDGAEEDSLRGLFLLQLKQQYDAADSDEERRRCADAARWGLAALDHAEEVDSL